MMIYPTIITPRKEPEIEASPPSAINEAANTDVPINTPPTIRRIVVMVLFSLIPTPKATKKSIVLFVKEIEPLNKTLQLRTNIIENLIRECIYGIRYNC